MNISTVNFWKGVNRKRGPELSNEKELLSISDTYVQM